MATTETHEVVIRWQQQGQQAIAAEAKSIQASFAGIPDSITKSFASAAASIKKSLATVSASAKQTGAVMSAAVSAPLLLMAKNAIGAASDLNESMSAVQTVFGASADEVIRFSENAATALGTSQQQALSAASALGALFQSIGLTNTQMADFTINLEQASADLGSFFNQDPSAVLDALKSGLVGEAEPLRKFGILLNEAAVEAEGVALGLIEVGGEMTDQQKVMARYQLIMEQIGVAQGDFARTSDGLANSQRILDAQIQDLTATIGTLLLPYAKQLVLVLKDLVGWVNNLSPPMKEMALKIGLIAAAIGPALLILGQIGGVLAALASGPFLLAAGAALLLYKAWTSNFLGIRDITMAVIDRIGEFVGRIVEFFTHARERGLDPFQLAMRSLIVTLGEQFGADNPVVEFLQGVLRNGNRLADYITNTLIPTFGELYTAISTGDVSGAADVLGKLKDDLQSGWDKTVGAWIDDQIAKALTFGGMLLQNLATSLTGLNWGALFDEIGTGLGTLRDAVIVPAISGLLTFGAQILQQLVESFKGVNWSLLWNEIVAGLGSFKDERIAPTISGLATFGAQVLGQLVASFQGINWSLIWNAIVTGLGTFSANALTPAWEGLKTVGAQVLQTVLTSFDGLNWSALGDTLEAQGAALIDALRHGLQDAWNTVLAPWVASTTALGQAVADTILAGITTVDWQAVGDEVGAQLRASLTGLDQFSAWVFAAMTGTGGGGGGALAGGGLSGDLGVWLHNELVNVDWQTVKDDINAGMAGPNVFTNFSQWAQDSGVNLHNQIADWLLAEIGLTSWDTAISELNARGAGLIDGLRHGAQDLWNTQIAPWFSGLAGNIQAAFNNADTWLTNAGAALIDGLRHGAQDLWNNQVAGWFTGLQGTIQAAFNNAASWLPASGTAIIQGLYTGVTGFWEKTVVPWFKNIGTAIQASLPKVADLQKILYDEGQAVAQGLVDGASATLKSFVDTFTDAIHDLQRALDVFTNNANKAAANAPASGGGGGGGGFGDDTNPKDHTHDIGGARGLVSQARRWAWVGEAGPELVKLPAGAMVVPHMASMSRAASLGAHRMASGGVVMAGEVARRRIADRTPEPLASVIVYGNVAIHPPDADVAGEIARQYATKVR